MINERDIQQARILVVDDQQANVELLARMLAGAGYQNITTTSDPRAVCALYCAHHHDLILLDMQMPGMDGYAVMEKLKSIATGGYLPVIVITAQVNHKLQALQAGAKDFISKPFDLAEVLARVRNMLEVRLLHEALGAQAAALEQHVRERTEDLRENYLETIFVMTRAAEHKDEDTGTHVQRISHYCRSLAQQLGMDEEFTDRIFFASPMHDIGKIGIPDRVLLKPGEFAPADWQVMRGHAAMGAKILGGSKSPYLRMGAEIALNHHERWDGSGYPNGRRSHTIPLTARILSICDIYDALRSKRPYKTAYDHGKAMAIIGQGDGRTRPEHFDPAILSMFQQHQQTFREIFSTFAEGQQDHVTKAALLC